MKVVFQIKLGSVGKQVTRGFDNESELEDYLETLCYDQFGIKEYIFIRIEDDLLIFKTATVGFDLVKTYSDYSWYEVAEFIGYEMDLSELDKSHIVEINVREIKAVFA